MPLTNPDVISDSVSLSDKLTRRDRPFVAEEGAVDALLPAVVDEFPPNKGSVWRIGSEADFIARPTEQLPYATIFVVIA
jgi:hypothetical protein